MNRRESAWSQSLSARGDALNLWVLRTTRQPSFEHSRTVAEALGPRPSRELLLVYFKSLRRAWSTLVFATALLAIGLAFVGNRLDGNAGNTAAAAAGFFVVGFCLGGEADAVWRHTYTKRETRQNLDRAGSADVERTARLHRRVHANSASVILQLLGGFIAAGVVLIYS